MKEKFDVIGMTCSACSNSVEKAVSKLNGVKSVNVNLLSNSMNVEYENIDTNEIIDAVVNAGYNAHVKNEVNKVEEIDESLIMKKRVIISFIFLIPLLYIAMGEMIGLPLFFLNSHEAVIPFVFTQFLLTLPIAFVNRNYFIGGFKSLFRKNPNMDSLIAIGSSAAIFYSVFTFYQMGFSINDPHKLSELMMNLYFESAGVILTLITLGKYLETKSKKRTKDAITKLMNLQPKTVLIEEDGIEKTIKIEDLKKGDVIIIKPGNSIPVDGVLVEGSSSVDESFLTGEAIPINKEIGDKVISATINKSGYFKFKAENVGEDTTLSKIIALIEEASSSKAPIAKLADKISGIFVPIVISISIISFIIWMLVGASFSFALSISIAILVISCPCALGLATPVAIMVGTGLGAENGILIKSAEALETAHKVNTIVLDKTGTITEGKLDVSDILTNIDENKFKTIAASLEKKSEHPLAQSIALITNDYLDVDSFESFGGKGISGIIENVKYYAGNLKLMQENNIDLKNYGEKSIELAKLAKTPIFFANEKEVIGIIAVMDKIRQTSYSAIKKFQDMQIDVIMLTGDNKLTANAIKDAIGIKTVIAEVLPHEKEEKIRELQQSGKIVAMVGDGINDAPALVRADVGIAIGAGSDIAIDSADVVLISSDLNNVASSILISRKVVINIKQNLFWAFIYNIIGIPLAAGLLYANFDILLNPMFAALAMSLSSVTVVLNALRLKKIKKEF